MARHEYQLVDVFTSERFAGNPLAVFPRAEDIGRRDMQRIARELNLSETTFVLPTDHPACDYRLRIFTPRIEMQMAGHPTIGTAWVLRHADRVTFLEGVGPIVVTRRGAANHGATWWMAQPLPSAGVRVDTRETVASALGLTADDIDPGLPSEVWSSGAPFLFVPLRSRDALARAQVRIDQWNALADTTGALGVFCFSVETGDPGIATRSRMFAPSVGVNEDPATGSASGPLGCYLIRYGVVPPAAPARIVSLQGVEMGRPSHVHIEIDGGPAGFDGVRVGGECVGMGGGYVEL